MKMNDSNLQVLKILFKYLTFGYKIMTCVDQQLNIK